MSKGDSRVPQNGITISYGRNDKLARITWLLVITARTGYRTAAIPMEQYWVAKIWGDGQNEPNILF